MDEQISELSAAARKAASNQDWAAVQKNANALLALSDNAPDGHFLSGLVAKAARQPKVAMAAFKRTLELDPKRYDAAIEMAGQHSIARDNDKAAQLLDQYRGFLGNSPRYLDMAATVYTEIGLSERALPLYEQATRLQPEIDLFQANLAACSVYLGKISQAIGIYENLLERYPAHQRNHYHLSRLRKATDKKHIGQMIEILQSTALPPEKNIFLYFAIGKEYEDLGLWDEAFEFFKRGGDAATKAANYQTNEDLDLIGTIINCCDETWLTAPGPTVDSDNSGPEPLFIVGLPRTGTTLTERIIGSHSQVQSVGETQFLQMVLRRESNIKTVEPINTDIIRAATKADQNAIAHGYLNAVAYRLGPEPVFIDKMPLNFLYLGFIAKAFPNARLVHLRRHPLDACFSMYKQVFTWAYKYSYSLDMLGEYYLAYFRLLQHWKTLLGERLIEVEYETLVSDQEAQTRLLLDKLGLEFEPACLNFHNNKTASTTASSVQVREKAHTRSVDRWKHFARHLEPLATILKENGILDENYDPIR